MLVPVPADDAGFIRRWIWAFGMFFVMLAFIDADGGEDEAG